MSLALTKIALESLQEGILFESCHKCDETLILVFNTYYTEMYILFYKKWVEEHLELPSLQLTIDAVERYAKKNV